MKKIDGSNLSHDKTTGYEKNKQLNESIPLPNSRKKTNVIWKKNETTINSILTKEELKNNSKKNNKTIN